MLQALTPQLTWGRRGCGFLCTDVWAKRPSWAGDLSALRPPPGTSSPGPAQHWHGIPLLVPGTQVQGAHPLDPALGDPVLGAPPTRERPEGGLGQLCTTATTRCRVLLSAIYHSDGQTNLKHLEIYVSDGSSCTVPLY